MALAGAGLLAFAPSGSVIDMLGWVWPPLLLALIAMTVIRVQQGSAQSHSVLGRVPAVRCIRALRSWGGYQTVRELFDRRTHSAPGQLVDVGGHRLHLHCVGSGTPTVILESGLGRGCARIGDGSRPLSHAKPKCAVTIARVEAGAILLLPRRTGSLWRRTSTPCSIGRTSRVPLCLSAIRRARSTSGSSPAGIPNRSQEWSCSTANLPKRSRGLPSYPAFYSGFRRISALLPSLARLGVGRLGLPRRLCQFARASTRHAASPLLVRSAVPQPARRIRRVAHVAGTGSFVSEPRRPAAGRRDRRTGCAGGMAAAAGQDGDIVDEQQPPRRALYA